MATWLKILIVLLTVHYALAIFVLYLVLKDNLRIGVKSSRAKLIIWNLTVLLLPIVGPIVYLVYRMIAKPQNIAPPSNTQTGNNQAAMLQNIDPFAENTVDTIATQTTNQTTTTEPATTEQPTTEQPTTEQPTTEQSANTTTATSKNEQIDLTDINKKEEN